MVIFEFILMCIRIILARYQCVRRTFWLVHFHGRSWSLRLVAQWTQLPEHRRASRMRSKSSFRIFQMFFADVEVMFWTSVGRVEYNTCQHQRRMVLSWETGRTRKWEHELVDGVVVASDAWREKFLCRDYPRFVRFACSMISALHSLMLIEWVKFMVLCGGICDQ